MKTYLTIVAVAFLLLAAPSAHADFVFNDLTQGREVMVDDGTDLWPGPPWPYNGPFYDYEPYYYHSDQLGWWTEQATTNYGTSTAYQNSLISSSLLCGFLSAANHSLEEQLYEGQPYLYYVTSNYMVDFQLDAETVVTFSGDAARVMLNSGDNLVDLVDGGTYTLGVGVYTLNAYAGLDLLSYEQTAFSLVTGSSAAPVPTPEPISMVMLGCLGAGMAAARKLRRKKA